MKFRTEIEIKKRSVSCLTSHGDSILMLGSCFTDEIGQKLEADGFNVTHNPMGPLFNPASISNAMVRASSGRYYTPEEMLPDANGIYHCMDFASRYQNADPNLLAHMVNDDLASLRQKCLKATVAILTLGTSDVFSLNSNCHIVGNCHKLPDSLFSRSALNPQQIEHYLCAAINALPSARLIVFTISPIRHMNNGLHGNSLSKARLLLAVDDLVTHSSHQRYTLDYFPAFEIQCDDLRDYRFYAPDMRHPSPMAVDYIYERFAEAYFSPDTLKETLARRAAHLRSLHRPINP